MPSSDRDSYSIKNDSGSSPSLVWTVHLAKSEPWKLVVVVFVCFAAAVIGYAFLRNPFPVIIMLAVLVGAISDFLLPVTYHIGPKGASSTSLVSRRQIRWIEVEAAYLDDHGVKLSPLPRCTSREALKGVYLRFYRNREHVIRAVKAYRSSQ